MIAYSTLSFRTGLPQAGPVPQCPRQAGAKGCRGNGGEESAFLRFSLWCHPEPSPVCGDGGEGSVFSFLPFPHPLPACPAYRRQAQAGKTKALRVRHPRGRACDIVGAWVTMRNPLRSRRPSQSLTTNSRQCQGMLPSPRTNSTPWAASSA